ncbi:hypothetical protein LCGC14_0852930 [marine sediment metagenome]|uniref:Uncharacterized protein n=1 Tax=marine sediment metagenome TaxID=412755 RepID=A0A0F9SGR6_9ZZZZ
MSHGELPGSPGDLHHHHEEKLQTFAGGGGSSDNLFQIKGVIELLHIYGIVETNLSADVDNLSLDVFPTGGALVALATLVDSASAPAGSLFVKMTDATNALVLRSSVVPYIAENTNWREPFVSPIIGAQGDGTDTFIRATYSGVATSGAITWVIEYATVNETGLVIPV